MGVTIQTKLERLMTQQGFVLQDSRKSVNRCFPILMPRPSAGMILSIYTFIAFYIHWSESWYVLHTDTTLLWTIIYLYTQLKNPRCLVLIIIYHTSRIHTFLALVLLSNTFSLTTFILKKWWLDNKNSLSRECKLLFAKRI